MKIAKCPLCDKEFKDDSSLSLTYQIKVWEIDGKKVELSCCTVNCPQCKKELVFRDPINARAAKNVEVYFKDLSRAVDDFIENNSNILNIGFYEFFK
jgi:endogenous inhibitor of DNA gyrase (YacG/DUF329 family)